MTQRFGSFALLVLTALTLGACSSTGSMPAAVRAEAASFGPPDGAMDTDNLADYRLGPNDVVEVNVFKVEELNRTARIDGKGELSLPLIGRIVAGGLTISELEADIRARYAADYIEDPQVSVFVKEFGSQKVTVTGEVREPGVFSIQGRFTLLQALAQAKGTTQVADTGEIVVFRTIGGKQMGAQFDLADIQSGRLEDPRIYGNDMIIVGASALRSFMRDVGQQIPILTLIP